MSCVTIPEGQYTFTPDVSGVGKVVVLNRHFTHEQLKSIAKVNTGGAAEQFIYNGIGVGKAATDVSIVGNNTEITLEFDTSSGFTSGDTLVIVYNAIDRTILNEDSTILATSSSLTSDIVNTNDYKSFAIRVTSDVDVIIRYHRYDDVNGGGNDDAIVFNLDAITNNVGVSPKKFRASLNNLTDTSYQIEIFNNSGGDATISVEVVASNDTVSGVVLPLEFPITTDISLPHNRSVIAAENEDASRVLTGNVSNVAKGANGGLNVSLPNAIVVDYSIPPASNLPSGSIPTIDLVLNTEPNVYDTGWYPVFGYPSGQLLNFKADQDTHIYLLNARNDAGDDIEGNTQAFLNPTANRATPFGSPYFDGYSRIVVVNNSGSDITSMRVLAKGRQVETPAIYTALDQPIFDQFPAPIHQSIIKGKDDIDSIYRSPNTHLGDNSTSLAVHIGNETSTIGGNLDVQKGAVATGIITPITTTVHTVTSGYELKVTNLSITVTNLVSTGGQLTILDSGTAIWYFTIAPGTNQTKTGLSIDIPMDFNPLNISTSLQFTLPAGLIGSTGAVNFKGYEKPL